MAKRGAWRHGGQGSEGEDIELSTHAGGGVTAADDGAVDAGLVEGLGDEAPEVLANRLAEGGVGGDEIWVVRAERRVENEAAAFSGDSPSIAPARR